jgi:hypothetical protein
VSAFIDEHRGRFGVEPICRTLGVSASAYYRRATGERSARAIEDERLLGVIGEVHAANYYAYGYRRTWKALLRAGEDVGRDRVKRLMRAEGIQGAKRRGKPWRTTRPEPAGPPPPGPGGAELRCAGLARLRLRAHRHPAGDDDPRMARPADRRRADIEAAAARPAHACAGPSPGRESRAWRRQPISRIAGRRSPSRRPLRACGL